MNPALIAYLVQAGIGISQYIDGKDKLSGLQRPEYKIPESFNTAVGLAKSQFADPRFAGQSQLEQNVNLNQAQALNVAAQRGNGMQAVAGIAAAGNEAAQNISSMQAQQQRQDQANFQQLLQAKAEYENLAFQMNKFAPYSEASNEGKEQIGAGQTNVFNALNNLGAMSSAYLSASQQMNTPQQAQLSNNSAAFSEEQNMISNTLAKQMMQWAKMAQGVSDSVYMKGYETSKYGY